MPGRRFYRPERSISSIRYWSGSRTKQISDIFKSDQQQGGGANANVPPQVQFFRDRWECSGIGTGIFALSAIMLLPYMIVSIMGGGTVLADISRGGANGAR